MCGYACIGCGSCGKPRTLIFPPIPCLRCGVENAPGAVECRACGCRFAPGVDEAVVSIKKEK